MRVGLGFDLHRLVPGRKFILCGMEIPCEVGPLGHSDADVALHALTDAILGAAGLPDLGSLFPETDPRFAGAESSLFLQKALEMISEKGLALYQVDLVLLLDQPKLRPHYPALRRRLADLLGIPEGRIGLKAKSTEGLGVFGGEAVAAWAVAVLAEVHGA
ncbi:2-C-methyl-D-erythritol 2,4-cyclodiphosphate synthase [Thermosulfurimonas marina]|uniref:2-C-methyl-D-erythritol 2,4-cyclodiphosphate synthase n=1 Tax=Thermosulfurimonas marina TaxID=2047767 RepID=A0A6H1WT07_9BACT|nr:2-C-methyl-D-erythritol 2,4-cyclodiphosphate synthase [Thermosulfurimonas marina]QJA06333.1 2-C-methyl-D-erythritol 2,4-cyclodiphosphate synthase [Thermosulfurimonas marina]